MKSPTFIGTFLRCTFPRRVDVPEVAPRGYRQEPCAELGTEFKRSLWTERVPVDDPSPVIQAGKGASATTMTTELLQADSHFAFHRFRFFQVISWLIEVMLVHLEKP